MNSLICPVPFHEEDDDLASQEAGRTFARYTLVHQVPHADMEFRLLLQRQVGLACDLAGMHVHVVIPHYSQLHFADVAARRRKLVGQV